MQTAQARVRAGEGAGGLEVRGDDDAAGCLRGQVSRVAGDTHVAEAVEGEDRLEDLRVLGRARPGQHPHVTLVLVRADDVGEEGAVRCQVLAVVEDDLGARGADGAQTQAPGDDLTEVEDALAGRGREHLCYRQLHDPAGRGSPEGLQAGGGGQGWQRGGATRGGGAGGARERWPLDGGEQAHPVPGGARGNARGLVEAGAAAPSGATAARVRAAVTSWTSSSAYWE